MNGGFQGYFHDKNKGYYVPPEVQGFADGTLDPQGVQPAPANLGQASFGSQPIGSSLPNMNYNAMVAADGGQPRSFSNNNQQAIYDLALSVKYTNTFVNESGSSNKSVPSPIQSKTDMQVFDFPIGITSYMVINATKEVCK